MANPTPGPLSASRDFQRTPRTPSARPPAGHPSSAGSRPAPTQSALPGPSPAYTANRRPRHALYGIEEHVILDLGSRVWKAGFSAEPRPRVVIAVSDLCRPALEDGQPLWGIDAPSALVVARDAIATGLRRLLFDHLMIDPKQRKVLLAEHALVPDDVRAEIAVVLFEHLHVPSISFTPSSVLVLMACGAATGLVIDVGHLETSVLPVFLSRPLFPLIKATTRAGSRLNTRLKALLLRFGRFVPLPKFGQSSVSTSAPRLARPGPVPRGLLTAAVVEDIKTRLLLVAHDKLHVDSHAEQSLQRPADRSLETRPDAANGRLLDALERVYRRSTPAETRDIIYRLPAAQQSPSTANGPIAGMLRIPGWIRERASEILFQPSLMAGGVAEEVEESLSVPEVVLESLRKLPVDLRKPMAASLVVCGGGAMLPGFVGRLKAEIVALLDGFQTPPQSAGTASKQEQLEWWRASRRKFSPISTLVEDLHILNDPQPAPDTVAALRTRPPAFQMHLLGWIGGSLAGALHVGGQEVIRERWDSVVEASLVSQEVGQEDADSEAEDDGEQDEWERRLVGLKMACAILPDWTRLSLA